jgi:hypothetical protein
MKQLSLPSVTLGLFLCTPILCSSAPSEWVQWDVSSGGNGHWYKPVPGFPGINWTLANELAQAAGGHLATITSAEENAFVFSLVANDPQYWNFCCNYSGAALGGLQLEGAPEPAGGWYWITGESWTYSNWYPGQPNNRPESDIPEERLHFFGPDGQWNDLAKLDFNLGGYVIERDTNLGPDRHHKVVRLRPLPSEHGVDDAGLPTFSGFGTAVAIRNGTAFVGITKAIGGSRVAVYSQTATGTGWLRTATLTVPDAPVLGENGFGRAIAFRDGLAVIASSTFLHVFRRINGVWTDVQKLAPPNGGTGAFWRISAMRFENGILLVGSSPPSGEGVVYVYELAANGKLVQRATLRAPDSSVGGFGSDVAVAANVGVVGARGAAYLFRRRSDGAWVRMQKLVGADASPVESFGGAVAIDRDMIIVGAPGHECVEREASEGGFCDSSGGGPTGPAGAGGAAYVFVPVAGRYVQAFKLRPQPDEHANYFEFGRRIVMMGNYIVIDAAAQSSPADSQISIGAHADGLTFTYRRDGSTVATRARGVTSGYVASDSIGLANNWLLVGTPFDSNKLCQSERLRCLGEASIFDLNRFDR